MKKRAFFFFAIMLLLCGAMSSAYAEENEGIAWIDAGTSDRVHLRALAAAGRAADEHPFARIDIQIDIMQRRLLLRAVLE